VADLPLDVEEPVVEGPVVVAPPVAIDDRERAVGDLRVVKRTVTAAGVVGELETREVVVVVAVVVVARRRPAPEEVR